MLTIVVPAFEVYKEDSDEFVTLPEVELQLEHSLVSLSKWESKFQKSFIGKNDKTRDEMFGYIECMILNRKIPRGVISRLTLENLDAIQNYIESKESATMFGELPSKRGPNQTITSELIYSWLVMFNIPFEVETWHLNRLFSLIRICNDRNQPKKKMSRRELVEKQRELNEKRRRQFNTSG